MGARLHGVCNSLINDFIVVSIATLGEKGTLQEIGKRAAWSLQRVEAASPAQASVVDLALDIAQNEEWFRGRLDLLATVRMASWNFLQH
jgi:hypothetical protein